jgi:hypothetical protein
MAILGWIVFGLVVGIVAKLLTPGEIQAVLSPSFWASPVRYSEDFWVGRRAGIARVTQSGSSWLSWDRSCCWFSIGWWREDRAAPNARATVAGSSYTVGFTRRNAMGAACRRREACRA